METALERHASPEVLAHFAKHQRLSVRQRKKWLEIILSFEMTNKYDVYDEDGVPALHVQELGSGFGAFLKRIVFGPFRWFQAQVTDLATQAPLLRLKRPFRFIFHRVEVEGPDGGKLGAIQRRWSWVRRIYTVEDAGGREIATLFGPIFRPWTFEIRLGGSEVPSGLLQKKWSGLFKEAFTDADNFSLDLSSIPDPATKALLFSATVLIDIVHFERAKG